MNIVLLFTEIVLCFGAVVLLKKLFGKYGLFVWLSVATVLANIMTAKAVNIAGIETTLGTVLFASTFLCTDIITECYGAADAKQAVKLGAISAVTFVVASQIALAYAPSSIDYANGYMAGLFSLNLRISAASVVMYFIANYVDVIIYDKMKKKEGDKRLWLRNNVATIVCNCLENFGFIALAFAGIYDAKTIVIIAASTSAIEFLVALCDTPFLYIAKGLNGKAGVEAEN